MEDNQNTAQAQAQIDELVKQAQQISKDIDSINRKTWGSIQEIRSEVKQTVAEIEAISKELNAAEDDADQQLTQLLQAHALIPSQA